MPKRRNKKKKALQSVGHGNIRKQRVGSNTDKVKIRHNGKTFVKNVTPGNRKNGFVFWYPRSDGGIALRNFKRDRNIKASRRSIKKKGFTGDG